MAPDPRFAGAPLTANDALVDAWIRHAHYLERFNAGEARKIETFLRTEVLPDIFGKLVGRLDRIQSRGFDTGIDTTQRWQELLDKITDIVDDGLGAARKNSTASLEQLSKYEAKWQANALTRAVPAELNIGFSLPSSGVLRELVSERPIIGHNLGDWWDKLTVDTVGRIEQQVRIGLAEGQSVPDIARRIRGTAELKGTDGVFEITNRQAQGIVRNASIHTSNQARQEVYKANRDVVKAERWISTLDRRTCLRCGGLDGQQFQVGEGPMPPEHPFCRCGRVPVLKTLRELGLKVKGFGPGTRASMDGPVAGDLTYSKWLEGLDVEDLQEAIGPSRARLFLDGDLSIDRMVDQSGRILTLDQIAVREGIEI